ncbi:wax ester/triacylglycerol synthase family O-acyltransferase [Massilia sp. TS11]|uniref:wax ester/triacylglycerol synthase family O-acyltransferase n=1 Tax=Massilia sp. TS11 TaxID=2908003 RepID=UPI001EDADE8A|nr:wax ester/triacylglycerol synthase family O-acyltransferase [Massilia sp. TS11]MCG2584269.1 wax ester/triacylglycerol synthase family O-acyltransferase [Massilia sp. TS11]
MSKLSLLDLAFFIAESHASPKHVAGLLILKRPPRARSSFARKLYEEYLTHTEVHAPFNRVIDFNVSSGMPRWREVEVDLNQHIFYHRLEKGVNGRDELYAFAARLHEPVLERERPLWELHVIDNLWDGHFAIYQRIHHAYADGMTMSRWTSTSLSDSPDDPELRPIWSIRQHGTGKARLRKVQDEAVGAALGKLKGWGFQLFGVARLTAMLLLETVKLTKNAIALPFVASPHTPLTGQVTAGRQFTAVGVRMERVKRIQAMTRSTLNHVALTCLDGALHRYLQEQGAALNQPIVIQMPVNLRREGEKTQGNKIGIILVELSPPTEDPYVRLRNIGFSLRNVRVMVDAVVPAAIETYTIVMGLFGQIAEMLKLSDQAPPTGNTLVSNVPGPKEHRYIKGAKMVEMHPMSTLPPSNLLNITLFSYAGELYFGLIATDVLPNLKSLGQYVLDAFDELESAILHPPRSA